MTVSLQFNWSQTLDTLLVPSHLPKFFSISSGKKIKFTHSYCTCEAFKSTMIGVQAVGTIGGN